MVVLWPPPLPLLCAFSPRQKDEKQKCDNNYKIALLSMPLYSVYTQFASKL